MWNTSWNHTFRPQTWGSPEAYRASHGDIDPYRAYGLEDPYGPYEDEVDTCSLREVHQLFYRELAQWQFLKFMKSSKK